MNKLLKQIQQQHPLLQNAMQRNKEVEKILYAFGTVLDCLNPIRNRRTPVHANPVLLEESDATLAVNAARTILHYIDAKLSDSYADA